MCTGTLGFNFCLMRASLTLYMQQCHMYRHTKFYFLFDESKFAASHTAVLWFAWVSTGTLSFTFSLMRASLPLRMVAFEFPL